MRRTLTYKRIRREGTLRSASAETIEMTSKERYIWVLKGIHKMTSTILARTAASVTDLKRNPMGTVAAGEGETVVILNRNEPAFYCVPPDVYEELMEIIEDAELNAIADARKDGPFIAVSLDDL